MPVFFLLFGVAAHKYQFAMLLPKGGKFYQCDIRQDLLPQKTFDAVVHLAALPGVRTSLHDPLGYEFTNVMGTIRLLEHARKMGTLHFFFASSSSICGPDTPCLRWRRAPPIRAAPTPSPSSMASNGAASMPSCTACAFSPCGSSPSGDLGNVPIWH